MNSVSHTLEQNLRRGGLHVLPASAQVVLELAQRIDAQFLSELCLLLLLGRQNLPQCVDLLFQLNMKTHNEHNLAPIRSISIYRFIYLLVLSVDGHTLASSW